MPNNDSQPDAALLIDWENLKYSLQNKGASSPNVSAIRDKAEGFGRVVIARAYADWQDGFHTGDPPALYAAGVEPVFVPTLRYGDRVKNSVDVRLSADCIELSHLYSNIETFVLATGDSDFLHVVNTLRPYGKRVIIIGVEGALSGRLAERVDGVLLYERDVDPGAAAYATAPSGPQAKPATTAVSPQVKAAAKELVDSFTVPSSLQTDLERVLSQIVGVVNEYRGAQRPLLLSQLGLELNRRVAAQTFAMVAKGKLKQLAVALERQKLLKVVTQGLVDWLYLPNEEVPDIDESEGESDAQSTSRVQESFLSLPKEERAEIVDAIRDLRAQPGISFLTFNRIRDRIGETTAGRRLGWSLHSFVQGMVDAGVLTRDAEVRRGFDPLRGTTYEFASFSLNLEHDGVRDVVGTSQ